MRGECRHHGTIRRGPGRGGPVILDQLGVVHRVCDDQVSPVTALS